MSRGEREPDVIEDDEQGEEEDFDVEIALETYVSIHATVAAGIPLPAALAAHAISSEQWLEIDASFAERLADSVDEDDGALVDAYDRCLIELQNARPRAVRPLDEDLTAFLDFVRRLAEIDEAASFLAARGLRAADLAILQRRWAERLSQDPALQQEAMKILSREPGPMPEVHAAPVLAALVTESAAPPPRGAMVVPIHAARVETVEETRRRV